MQVGSAAPWPVAQRAADLGDRQVGHIRCLDCPTAGVCQARGHGPRVGVFDVVSAAVPDESS